VWRQDMSKAAEPRAKLSRRGLRWALEGIVCQHLTVARIAEVNTGFQGSHLSCASEPPAQITDRVVQSHDWRG